MSDKSFGDYTNRNVVKNPLLSTAVTGLSIEDLTHNAVLLPAVPSQELILRQDQQQDTQMRTLQQSDYDTTNLPSGDANFNPTLPNPLPHTNPTSLDIHTHTQINKTKDDSIATLSKASAKSDDDFDVNEYFARLQCTRYVSAPLNSNIKEDQNANLQEEENLEEINLNEPDKAQCDDTQQSLTSDIAQNFSQLPTVLPQVASVVFSSFSNMLNLKSREQTPDERAYHEVPPQSNVELEVPSAPVHVALPPLKEPPITGNASNYRITTRKKVYAQIPGLSSGESHVQTFNPLPTSQIAPSYFIPEANVADASTASVQQVDSKVESFSLGFDAQLSAKTSQTATKIQNDSDETKPTNVFKATAFESNNNIAGIPIGILSLSKDTTSIPAIKDQENISPFPTEHQPFIEPSKPKPSTSIIPPPPMFSNLPRKDTQTFVEKSILPPSVARRISTKQPIIKPQAPPSVIMQENIFVPTMPPEKAIAPTFNLETPVRQNYFQHFDLTSNPTESLQSRHQLSSNVQTVVLDDLQETMQIPNFSNNPSAIGTGHPAPSTESVFSPQNPNLMESLSSNIQTSYETPEIATNHLVTDFFHDIKPTQKNIALPQFSNPLQPEFDTNLNKGDKNDLNISQSQVPQYLDSTPIEQPKLIPEPPKISGNLNYRMSKKKPQYYSGPIEGVGSISNNIKPIIDPVNTSSCKLSEDLDPERNIEVIGSYPFYPDRNTSSGQFDLSKPDHSYQPYDIKPNIEKTQFDLNTVFDLSRPTTDKYEQPQQESRTFGIIGSLKSKLSSIDINKIQNTVTTFFDPAYNNPKIDEEGKTESTPSGYPSSPENYCNYPQNEATTLEVFVPDANREQHYSHSNPYITPSNIQNQMYYPTQDYSCALNQSQTFPTSNYYPGWSYTQQRQPELSELSTSKTTICSENNFKQITEAPNRIIEDPSAFINPSLFNQENLPHHSYDKETTGTLPEVKKPIGHFNTQKSMTHTDLDNNNKMPRFIQNIPTKESEPLQVSLDSTAKSFFDFETSDLPAHINTRKISTEYKTLNIDDINKPTSNPLKAIFDNSLPIEQSLKESGIKIGPTLGYGSDFISEPSKISQVFTDPPSKGFFHKETSIVLPYAIKKPDDIKLIYKEESLSVNAHSRRLATTEPVLEKKRNKNDIQGVSFKQIEPDMTKVTEDIVTKKRSDLDGLPKRLLPDIETKSVHMKTEHNDVLSGQIQQEFINSNLLQFSLFESSPKISSAPLFKLPSLTSIPLSDPITKENEDLKDIETQLEKVLLDENVNTEIVSQQSYNYFGNVDISDGLLESQVSDLNICETCREVNKPEEREADDLTTQLIENITAPIQLANPVEYPVMENENNDDEKPDYSEPLPTVSHITQDILQSLSMPPPVELIDDMSLNNSILNFGWSTGEPLTSKALIDHNYSFQLDANSLGLMQDESLFFENIPTNACDEIKAEYRNSQEEVPLLTLPLILPTASHDEDTKSDESGLDVQSIEQDAKKDFPLFEDFPVEPSETDDDKIEYRERERSSDDPAQDVDTFTNRVERFKKMENTASSTDNKLEIRKEIKAFELPTSTSPAITIASYFDTGNYAVENHFRNSLTSPTTLSSFNTKSTSQMRIPPGFEEEYQRRLSGISSQDITLSNLKNQVATYISDTSNDSTLKQSFVQPAADLDDDSACDFTVETMVEQLIEDDNSPNKIDRLPAFSNLKEPKHEIVEEKKQESVSCPDKTIDIHGQKMETLTEPINLLPDIKMTEDSDVYSNFSRLSSYFTTPPKTDHSKSFFELSQSQDHYRHKPKEKTFDSIETNVKNFFETANFSNEPSKVNIPQSHLANINLINDLTSSKNLNPNDDIVKTVNYFTVEYDSNNKYVNLGEPLNKDNKITTTSETDCKELKFDDKVETFDINDIINCQYCCTVTNIRKNIVTSLGYKVKKNMENNPDGEKQTTDVKDMESKKDSIGKKNMSVNFCEKTFENEDDERIVVVDENRAEPEYAPVKHHWFYQVDSEDKSIWRGFSVVDSAALEKTFHSPDLNENTLVPTDGGRFDVNIVGRLRIAVYWNDKPTNVMRCSWFYKGTTDARYVPYSESIAEKLEEEYHHGITTGEWHRRLMLPNNELVVMHGPAVMVHFLQNSTNDAFSSTPLFFGKQVYRNPPKIKVSRDEPEKVDHLIFLVHGAGEYRQQKEKLQAMMRPRVVRRGHIETEIEDPEPSSIDHLLLLCHGVGSACDMRFRRVEEVVDDFRTISLQLIQSHYKNSFDNGLVGRVEVLPISWHSSLHSGQTGVDRRLAAVTLESIPRLRNFTNDTILDVLFYTSPVFCQTIIDTVCGELNRIYNLFKKRNPDFKGGVSLGGHSLGSVILYDLLCHQMPKDVPKSNEKHYVKGAAGTGQPCVSYPNLEFTPDALYALGSPIAIFECIRGVETLGEEFCLPTCKNFFNIFHPYDPIAYRIEPLINPHLRDVKPYLIPHHKGRKRMHLELKDTMARVGADLKQKLMESIRSTWASVWKTQPPDAQLEKVVEEEMEKEELNAEPKEETAKEIIVTPEMLGKLNDGRRIDHVLQEAPFEMINEYLFAMRSHLCYWESEDTMLVMLREVYGALGVSPDCCLPQQSLSVERARASQEDENIVSPSDHPSTSRGNS